MTIDVCQDFILFFCAVAFPTVKDCPAIAVQCLHVLIHDLSICVHIGLGNISFTVSDDVSWQCPLWQTACSPKFLASICLFSLSMSYLDCVDPSMFPFFGSFWGLDFLELVIQWGHWELLGYTLRKIELLPVSRWIFLSTRENENII